MTTLSGREGKDEPLKEKNIRNLGRGGEDEQKQGVRLLLTNISWL